MKKAGKAVHGAKAAVQSAGYEWENAQMHEHEVNLLQRFLVDSSLSSGRPACFRALTALKNLITLHLPGANQSLLRLDLPLPVWEMVA